MAESSNKITVKCPRENCGYIWNYSGDKKMATCPSCSYKCNVEDNQIDG
jgi:hypothetical protein